MVTFIAFGIHFESWAFKWARSKESIASKQPKNPLNVSKILNPSRVKHQQIAFLFSTFWKSCMTWNTIHKMVVVRPCLSGIGGRQVIPRKWCNAFYSISANMDEQLPFCESYFKSCTIFRTWRKGTQFVDVSHVKDLIFLIHLRDSSVVLKQYSLLTELI
jgi:hypothetical protein